MTFFVSNFLWCIFHLIAKPEMIILPNTSNRMEGDHYAKSSLTVQLGEAK